MQQNLSFSRSHRLTSGLIAIAILTASAVFWGLEQKIHAIEAQSEIQTQVSRAVTDVSNQLAESLGRKLQVARALKSAISLRPNMSQEDFSVFAATMVLDEPSVIDIATVENFQITRVFPHEKNLALLGRDLRNVPEQAKVVAEAQRTGKTAIHGPIQLLQGIPGYIIRQPVFVPAGKDKKPMLWGTVSVVIDGEKFLSDIVGNIGSDPVSLAVRYNGPAGHSPVIAGNAALFDGDNFTQSFEIENTSWTIAAAPNLAANAQPEPWRFSQIVIITAGLIAAYMAWQIMRLREVAWRNSVRLAAAVQVLPDGFVLFDDRGRLIAHNERYKEIYAKSAPAIFPGARFRDILRHGLEHGQYPEAKGREEQWLQERLAAHNEADTVLEQKVDSGQWLRIYEKATPDGGRVGIRIDITDQVVSRQRAELAEQRLKDAIRNLPVGFCLFDSNGNLVLNNELPLLQGGRPRPKGEVLNLDDLIYSPWQGNPRFLVDGGAETTLQEIAPRLRCGSFEFEVDLDGDEAYKCFSHPTSEGGMVVIWADVSDLNRSNKNLQIANDSLKQVLSEKEAAERRFDDVADTASEWFWEQDDRSRFTFLSSGFQRSTGIDPATVLGKTRSELIARQEPDQDSADMLAAMENREPFRNFIYRTSEQYDQTQWIRTSGKPVFDQDGAFVGYRGVASDITPLYTALKEAERADEAKTQFLSVISHELRTPLTAIIGYSAILSNLQVLPSAKELAQRLAQNDDALTKARVEALIAEISGFLNKMQTSGRQLQVLIDDMLDLARIEANTVKLDIRKVETRPVIESIVDQMKGLAEEKGLRLCFDVAHTHVLCDEVRLRQILFNLVGNAIKFSRQGTIRVSSQLDGGQVQFVVEDSGIGIPPDMQATIFDRFVQVDNTNARRHGGIGLGLSICRDLVTLQGGKIELSSTPDIGSRFTFTLPAHEDCLDSAA
ncbi:ATP-binding protein [Thalassovita sp.]|uniref:ATP-binding protein n=1 Tax=Thalassovita sp. TaxID=1979401 RepID=UPI0029DE5D5B|nr:ATP-binding protein [Thalassovita sp.]